ncbi:MAG: phosphoribosylformylglycinamidine cyclo-ligase [Actinomycetota bacterium]|nr:phosphoribosylformylglycinamidine cyclo-ligase [Actinomycetota bacterium]MDA2980413.1 phosphoribosylformylglycinamidine cyclo-ligase [Actinomycetota bacterium]
MVSLPSPYQSSGVDTSAGDRAVDLMKAALTNSHSSRVIGGVGGFAGLYDASFLTSYRAPILATSTDGVGTKVAIAQAMDVHDTIGYDLVGMVVDDIVVVGATPLFMTDYIACGKVVPQRIADIVRGIAEAAASCGVSVVGGETAEHPGLLEPDEYDVAGAATGVVEADQMLDPSKVRAGDVVIAMASNGLHSNGFSLVRKIVAERGWDLHAARPDFSRELGLELLEPTMLYTSAVLELMATHPGSLHMLSHVTGGGIAQNLSRVIPRGLSVDVDRSTWSPPVVMQVLADAGGFSLGQVEDTWNMGIGMVAVVDPTEATAVSTALKKSGHRVWQVGIVREDSGEMSPEVTTSAKGVEGGAIRLVGTYADSSSASS